MRSELLVRFVYCVIVVAIITGWCPPQRSFEDCLDEGGCWRKFRVHMRDGLVASGDRWKSFGSPPSGAVSPNFKPSYDVWGYYANGGPINTGRRLGTVWTNGTSYSSSGDMNGVQSFPTCVTLSAIYGLLGGNTHKLMDNPTNGAATKNYFYVSGHSAACPGKCLKYYIRFSDGKVKFRVNPNDCILEIDVLCDPVINPVSGSVRCFDCP